MTIALTIFGSYPAPPRFATLTGQSAPVRIVDAAHVPESRGGPSTEVRWEEVPDA